MGKSVNRQRMTRKTVLQMKILCIYDLALGGASGKVLTSYVYMIYVFRNLGMSKCKNDLGVALGCIEADVGKYLLILQYFLISIRYRKIPTSAPLQWNSNI